MKIAAKSSAAIAVMAALLFGTMVRPAVAVDFRKPRAQKDLTPALQQSLSEKVSDQAFPYIDEEEAKKKAGKKYTDLQQKFEYLPNYGPRNSLVVSVKLGGAEYDPGKPGSSRGAATGTLRFLVFTYALQGKQWVEIGKPKWEEQALGTAAGKQMTENMARGDKRKAAIEKATQTKAAAAAAAAAAQKAANKNSN